MKKSLIFVAVAAISLASCKKDRVCTCTVVPTSGTGYTYTVTYFKASKKNAALFCASEATERDQTAPTSVKGDKTTCELK